ncbi:MAG: 4Fe-4S binding protein [Eubacteriales bacterium]|jgi:ferredoxin|nr:4Fe-4S binding protein [Bacillota bacterium]
MKRKIITIDQDKCVGCGLCVNACQEGAIGLVDGKAQLLRDDYCDGLGNCLPVCPTNAISFEEREAAPFNKEAVKLKKSKGQDKSNFSGGCPGSRAQSFRPSPAPDYKRDDTIQSQLGQWPVQIQLVPVNAPYFDNAKLLVAADCTAFAYGDFHQKFMRDHVTIIGCPKLDMTDYSEKLTHIIRENNIKSVTIVRMSVPCCGGLENAVKTALKNSGKFIPWQIQVISPDGQIID